MFVVSNQYCEEVMAATMKQIFSQFAGQFINLMSIYSKFITVSIYLPQDFLLKFFNYFLDPKEISENRAL